MNGRRISNTLLYCQAGFHLLAPVNVVLYFILLNLFTDLDAVVVRDNEFSKPHTVQLLIKYFCCNLYSFRKYAPKATMIIITYRSPLLDCNMWWWSWWMIMMISNCTSVGSILGFSHASPVSKALHGLNIHITIISKSIEFSIVVVMNLKLKPIIFFLQFFLSVCLFIIFNFFLIFNF